MDLGRARTDHALAARIAAGDDHAFELLGQRHRPRLLRFAAGRLGERRDEAEDVVQDALLRAFRALRGGKVPEHVSAWLHTIVAHCCADRHQAASRRPTVALHEDAAAELPGSVDPHAAAVRRAEVEQTVSAIAALPDAQRRAFVGYELEGRTYADLGHEHGWSLSATKSLLWRARDNLAGSRAGWNAIGGAPLVAAARTTVNGWTDRLAALLPHGGEALACVGVAAALSAPGLPEVAEVVAAEPRAAATRAAPPPRTAEPPRRAQAAPAPGALTADEVLRRCASGAPLDGAGAATLSRARGEMAVDQAEYSRCSSAIDRALLLQRP